MGKQHLISKTNLRETHWVDEDSAPLASGQARLKLDAFALTANNVTYAAFGGPPMHYWNFFPAEDASMGRVPVWGFATVSESTTNGVEPGQRIYGYFPIAEELVVSPIRVSDRGFMDGADHRQGLAPIYNTYTFTGPDPAYVEGTEAQQMLFRPLYMTAWMICDFLTEADPVPDAAIISSASSKTALGVAHGLQRRGIKAIGLTSPRNVDFVTSTKLYDEVVTYEDADSCKISGAAAYVDFVGRPELTRTIHTAYSNQLAHSMMIGATDWEDRREPLIDLPGPEPKLFFVPDYATMRAKQLPAGDLERRSGADLVAFYPVSKSFVRPKQLEGTDAIGAAWLQTVEASVPADQGLICSF